VEHLLLVPVEDLAESLTDLHVRGLRIIGSDADASLTARQADLRGPMVVVVGSEGQGLGPAVRRRCDTVVRIPMRGRVTSLNAAVAGSILLYEASSQRAGDRPLIGPEPGVAAELSQAPEPGAAAEPATVPEPGTVPEPATVPEPGAAAEPESAPAPRPRPRRRSTTKVDPAQPPVEPPVESEEEALLPGASAVDSSDAATAE
jgi:hypothetical protein